MTVDFAEEKHLCHTKFSARSLGGGLAALARITLAGGDDTADAEGARSYAR